ncbi:hypothetical protein COHA_002468 [Chlorella ohadii]|uniref:Ankyrin repeat domain-containing protein n=1 Tax=Chlorella ohadii TaxID=2649997 RepID=A0AAD5DUJ3_9CHLO|nr:hypothetical protein COHA_002468 [Chlorella ohadii]
MLPLRASLLALALLAAALAPAVAQDAAAMPAAAAAAPAPEGMAAAAPAAENALVSQYRLSPAQVAVLEQAGLTDPDAIMADLQQAGVTPRSEVPMGPKDPTLYDYVMFAFIKTGDADAARRMLTSADAPANANVQDAATGETPIFSAVEQTEQTPELLALLLQNGADTNVRRNDGEWQQRILALLRVATC